MITKKSRFLFLLLCIGCTHQPDKINIAVHLTDRNRAIGISGFNRAIIAEINRDTANGAWQSLLPVYRMPADTDMKDFQNAQPGSYHVNDSLVIFTPDTPFRKGQPYFLRFFEHDENTSAWQYIKGKIKIREATHTDLIFKY